MRIKIKFVLNVTDSLNFLLIFNFQIQNQQENRNNWLITKLLSKNVSPDFVYSWNTLKQVCRTRFPPQAKLSWTYKVAGKIQKVNNIITIANNKILRTKHRHVKEIFTQSFKRIIIHSLFYKIFKKKHYFLLLNLKIFT